MEKISGNQQQSTVIPFPISEDQREQKTSTPQIQRMPVSNIGFLIEPAKVVINIMPAIEEKRGIEERIEHYYSEIGIDFKEETDFFEVFDTGMIAKFLRDLGYKTNASREDFSKLGARLREICPAKDFTKMFGILFLNEGRLDYVYNNRKYPKIDSKYYVDPASTAHDIALELNEKSRAKGILFAERAIRLCNVASSMVFATRSFPASFYHTKMVQLYAEMGIAQIEEHYPKNFVNESIIIARNNLNLCIDNYRITMYDILRRQMLVLLTKISKEARKGAEKIEKLVQELDLKNEMAYDPYLPHYLIYLVDIVKEISSKITEPSKGFSENMGRMEYIHNGVMAALANEIFYPTVEKELNFFFRRLIILIDRHSRRFDAGENPYERYTELFEEPFGKLAKMGAKHRLKRRDNAIMMPYSEIGSFKNMFLMYAQR